MNTNQQLRQLSALTQRLEKTLGEKHDPDKNDLIRALVRKIRGLVKSLLPRVTVGEIRKTLGALIIFLGITLSKELQAQSFLPPVTNPFGLDSAYYQSFPAFADLDNDGDLDLLIGEYYGNKVYYVNTGSANNPQFSILGTNPYGIQQGNYLSLPEFVDLDDDGDFDLLCGEYYGALAYYENVGTAQIPSFTAPVINPFGLDSGYYFAEPAFADLDNDGDLDLMIGEYYGKMKYFENTGTASAPQFSAPILNPFGLPSTKYVAFIDFADLDNDGDMDLIAGEAYGVFQYFENTGSVTFPQFSAPQANPFGLDSTYSWASPQFVDLDNDGDFDIMAGEGYGALKYFENNTPVNIKNTVTDPLVKIYPNPVVKELHFHSRKEISAVTVVNINGQVVKQSEGNVSSLNVEDLSRGVYLVKISFISGEVINRKVRKLN